jgi:hypothetical protein
MDISDSKRLDNIFLLNLPWAWALAKPNQPPSTIELSTKESEEMEVIAAYSEGMKFRWERTSFTYSTLDTLTIEHQNMKSPCREGWARINICLPLKSTQAVPPGLVLFPN